jgi:hypothetical protein
MSDKSKTEQKVVQPGQTVPDELQRVNQPGQNPAVNQPGQNPAVKSAMPVSGAGGSPTNPVANPVNPARESGAAGVAVPPVPSANPVNASGVPVTGLNPIQVGSLGANPNVSNPNPVTGGVQTPPVAGPLGGGPGTAVGDSAHNADHEKVRAGEVVEKDEDEDEDNKESKY